MILLQYLERRSNHNGEFLGNHIKIQLVPFVINEYEVMGSPSGNYNELRKVMELAKNRKIKHSIHKFSKQNTNEALSSLKKELIVGRAVVVTK
jgi:D-arabinose 1-dehydrogenase-like Zn-dependent alcohol dehydrogenase